MPGWMAASTRWCCVRKAASWPRRAALRGSGTASCASMRCLIRLVHYKSSMHACIRKAASLCGSYMCWDIPLSAQQGLKTCGRESAGGPHVGVQAGGEQALEQVDVGGRQAPQRSGRHAAHVHAGLQVQAAQVHLRGQHACEYE